MEVLASAPIFLPPARLVAGNKQACPAINNLTRRYNQLAIQLTTYIDTLDRLSTTKVIVQK
jgi:hypothetical protein